jgi:hypothetical protein
MRQMKNIRTGKIINVIEFIMLKKSSYEYYITDKSSDGGDAVEILAYGIDVEMAIVSLTEVKSQAVFQTKNLENLLSVPGWKWLQ